MNPSQIFSYSLYRFGIFFLILTKIDGEIIKSLFKNRELIGYKPMCNSDKIIVESAQIHNGFAGQRYLPYSIEILQVHVLLNLKKKERYNFRSTIYKKELLNGCQIILLILTFNLIDKY
tara:strand:+ start:1576 stop:1932 length:357 start_codon:yes stop_codon:yes gene_type:complete